MKRWQKLSYEFVCIFFISLVIGVGIGWLQGAVAFRSLTDAESGVIIGGLFSIIMGPFVYYAFLRKCLTVKNAANLIMVCLVTGLLSALMFGWTSSVITPIALFMGALVIWRKAIDSAKTNSENNKNRV